MQDYGRYWSQKLMLETQSFLIFSIGSILIFCGILSFYLMKKNKRTDISQLELEIYRQQLEEVSKDHHGGILSVSEEAIAKKEIKKKILISGKGPKLNFYHAPRNVNIILTVLMITFFVVSSSFIYSILGSYGQTDRPIKTRLYEINEFKKNRLSQKDAEQQISSTKENSEYDKTYLDLIQKLRETVEQNDYDIIGLRLLVKYEISIEQFVDAHIAQKKLLDQLGDDAKSEDYSDYAQILINAAKGYISPEAEISLKKALTLDQKNRKARYFIGLLMVQINRPDLALNIWNKMLTDKKNDDIWSSRIRIRIVDVERRAGLRND